MASILPGFPPGYRANDVPGTVREVCGYLRGLQEQVGLQLSYLQKENAALKERLAELEGRA